MDSDQLETIENLYTIKKIQSKVNDKVVPWIDFQALQGSNRKAG